MRVEAIYSSAAARLVKEITSKCIKEHVYIGLEQSRSLEFHRTFDMALADQHNPPKALEGLAELLSQSYWERIWIIQDIARVLALVVRCGKLTIDLHTLLRLRAHCRQISNRSKVLLAAISKFRAQELRKHSRMSLVQALTMSGCSVSPDEQNKICALLGLAHDSASLMPLPTYVTEAPKVFKELTRTLLESYQLDNVLLLAQRSPLAERVSSAPPWCIDWAQLELSIPDWVADSFFHANRSQSQRPIFSNSTLHVQGHAIGHISSHEREFNS